MQCSLVDINITFLRTIRSPYGSETIVEQQSHHIRSHDLVWPLPLTTTPILGHMILLAPPTHHYPPYLLLLFWCEVILDVECLANLFWSLTCKNTGKG